VAEPSQYQSLYRRYRPQRFSEIRGQDHVVLALRNAVRDDRVAHAYLFSGPRGTGKTSTARILAKALNCAAPVDGEPCGECDSCRDIARGASLDVHELDAASNNGVDAMRDLVARASLATPGKWKVYIVDEVHMLSTAASNALLKTLEEPPGHVVFVLATTDPQKVLPTIKSRTQHYEFHLLDPGVLSGLLSDVARQAELELPASGVEAAVRRGHGSARDALSALDQVVAAGLVEDDVRFVRQLVTAIAERDSTVALQTVGEALVAGYDAGRLAAELVDALRVVFLGAVAPGLPPPAGAVDVEALSQIGPARCVRALELVGAAIVDMRETLDARTTFEVALVRLTHPEADDGPAAVLDRLERLERRVQELAAAPPPAGGSQPAGRAPSSPHEAAPPPEGAPGVPAPGGRPALGAFRPRAGSASADPGLPGEPPPRAAGAAPGVRRPPAAGSAQAAVEAPIFTAAHDASPTAAPVTPSRDDLVTAWADHVLPRLRPRVRAVYAVGRFVSSRDGTVVFALPNSAHVEHAEPLREEVSTALGNHFGGRLSLRLVTDPDAAGEAAAVVAARPAASADRDGETDLRARRPAAGRAAAARDGSGQAASDAVADFDSEMGDAAGSHDPLEWAQSRLLQEFPGAEEVPDGS
jgi:DNA polymerase-3 subunit gamma/tau